MKTFLSSICLLAGLHGCGEKAPGYFPGYVEADYVRLASPVGGTVAKLFVQRGSELEPGDPVFVLEQDSERAARQEAAARVQRARSTLADLEKGRRPEELAVARQQLAQAEAALSLSQAELAREARLLEAKFVAPARLDQLRAAVRRDRARVAELVSQLQVARLGARADELAVARHDVEAAQAQLAQAEWQLARKAVSAPVRARVADVLYREGELAPPGAAVASLLAPEFLRARFFVPQAALGALALGDKVTLACDGCGQPVAATISHIAREAEYTAPLIYSRENRAALVFMVEATPAPEAAPKLHPGQPLEIRLAPR
ncbi:HlyD family efflux transporter periplasmic adaptor subunit [Massilia sp. RP-1-19]|uniref:HlyD family efflux transporter periplasmic adaptor subunit n=1 Tax=Massilia polaris TaxID=2728846 RepID=A0A848HET8_9BURK|nr:HlyD family efflux transporter periplasmic adaptor subunit [Massilia polaris]NML59754.1 HlyD family efflux transporter periplasmic adaptor subunit [Massilia polaris]